MTDVFISYSRKDIAFARLLHQALKDNQLDTWIDWQDIPPSADWLVEVYEAIEQSNAFIFIISGTSLSSEICSLEIAHAVQHNKRLIPIVIQDIEAGKIPQELSALNWIFFDEESKYKDAIDDLITAITVDQDWVKAHTRFQTRALDWERKEKDGGLLLRGGDLTNAESWLAMASEKEPEPTALQTQYILKSREDSTRRQRIALGAVGIGLVISIVLGILAWNQRNLAVAEGSARATQQSIAEEQRDIADEQRIVAEARQLAALSHTYVETDLDLAILLAIEGHQRDPNYLTQGSILTVLQEDPFLIRQFHQRRDVADLVFDPDGEYFVSVSSSNIFFWDPIQGTQLYDPIVGHLLSVSDIEISPDGSLLASTSEDGTLKIWDLNNERSLKTTLLEIEDDNLYQNPEIVSFSPDGNALACLTESNDIWVWDTQSFQVISNDASPLEIENSVDNILLDKNDHLIISQYDYVEIWDYRTGEVISELYENRLEDIVLSPNSEYIAGFDSNELRVLVWDSSTYQLIKNLKITSSNYDYSYKTNIEFHPDGELIYIITDAVIQYLDWENPEKLETFKLLSDECYTSQKIVLAFSPDGRSLIHGCTDGVIFLRSVYDSDNRNNPFYNQQGAGFGLTLSPDESLLAATGQGDDGNLVIHIWDFQSLNYLNMIELGLEIDEISDYYTLLFNPDNQLVLSANSPEIKFIDPFSSEIIDTIQTEDNIKTFTLSPDGKLLAVLYSLDYDPEIWDLKTHKRIGELTFEEDIETLAQFYLTIAFSPDSQTLAGGTYNGGITIWDINTMQLFGNPIIAHEGPVQNLAFSYDGKILASADFLGTVILWDPETRYSIGVPMYGDNEIVKKILFNHANSILFTGDGDGELRVWDVHTQQPVGMAITDSSGRQLAADLPGFDSYYGRSGHTDTIANMVLSTDDRYLVSMDSSGNLRIWDFEIDSWYKKACLKAGRNLTQNEWGLYFPNEPFNATCPQFDNSTIQTQLDLSNYTYIIRDIDNMTQVFVPAGDFEFGSRTWTDDGEPYRIIYLEEFWIDQTEVSNAQYLQCVEAGYCTPPARNSSISRISNYFGYDTYADFPVINVNFLQAEDYCEWVGARIPIETEWEKAARGTTGYEYPWGNEDPTPDKMNFHLLSADTSRVGSYPEGVSPYGALDMAGNVWEWTYDYNTEIESDLPHRIRGGSWMTSYAETWLHQSAFEGYFWYDTGFRCANDG